MLGVERTEYNEHMRQYMATRRAERRARLIKLSGGVCARGCGQPGVEFNHRDRTEKRFGLDKRGMDRKWSTVLEEWAKCELLCVEHHLEYTRQQYANGEIRPWNDRTYRPQVCGTARSYEEARCRCDQCRTAKSMYRRKEVSYAEVIAP